MKRLFFICCTILFFLCSCKKNIEVTFSEIEGAPVYALNSQTSKIEEVIIDYEIKNEKDVFMLYTSHQNALPIGYQSPANPNITLLFSEVKNNIVLYTVDNFILLSDINAFHDVLKKTLVSLGYQEVHIILNENQLI